MDVFLRGLWFGTIIFAVMGESLKDQWVQDPVFKDKTFSNNLTWSLPGSSPSVCGSLCSREPDCLSFTWNTIENICQGFSVIFYMSGTTWTGNLYFKRKDYCYSFGYTESPQLPIIPVCFKYFATPLPYTSAQSKCTADGGTLLRIRNAETMEYIAEYLRSTALATDDVFIDGNDMVADDDWRYSDNSVIDYFLWDDGEPGGYYSCVITCTKKEDCMALQDFRPSFLNGNTPFYSAMNDMDCLDPYPFICQKLIYD